MDRSDGSTGSQGDPQTVHTEPDRGVAPKLPAAAIEAAGPPFTPVSAERSGFAPPTAANERAADVLDVSAPAAVVEPRHAPPRDFSKLSVAGPGEAGPFVLGLHRPTMGAVQSQSAPLRSFDLATLARKGLRLAGIVFACWFAVVLALVAVFRFVDPPFSALMAGQWLLGRNIAHISVPLDAVSPQVVRAVMLSEDGRFCEHWGVDFEEMQNAFERAGNGLPRGASTISMQVAKNLFLWPSKSLVRKAVEIPLTFVIEALWSKRRIMEVYLNLVEWGPGIFGVEAAARYHFDKPASRLNEREAARLAVALPNPIRRDAGDPGPLTQRLAIDIQARMRAAPRSATQCVGTRR